MAISIINDFDEDKVYSCFQNVVIEFETDNIFSTISHGRIEGFDYPIKLQPIPDTKKFWVNLQQHLKNALVKKLDHKYAIGDIPTNNESFKLEITNDFFFQEQIGIFIHFDDNSLEYKPIGLKSYIGVRNFTRHQNEIKNYQVANKKSVIYWKGLPFTLTFLGLTDQYLIRREADFSTASIPLNPILGDSRSAFSITFDSGLNELKTSSQEKFLLQKKTILKAYSDTPSVYIRDLCTVHKKFEYCYGPYFKWLNQKGGWSYFMFNQLHEKNTKAKDLGSINNDFENFGINPSPQLQIGKSSLPQMQVVARKTSELERNILEDIIDSPKIFLYTNQPNTQSTPEDWLEVKLKSSDFINNKPGYKIWDINFDFEFPENYTQKI